VCDGNQTVAKVLDRLANDLPQFEEEARSYVSRRILSGAHSAGFLDIYRPLEVSPHSSAERAKLEINGRDN
jgi:hypothetical protein